MVVDTLQESKINAEYSLQRASHNSRKIHQQQSWSQIRQKWAMFIINCYWRSYVYNVSLLANFYHFLAAKALR